jgi:hypothetical protein
MDVTIVQGQYRNALKAAKDDVKGEIQKYFLEY